MIMILILIVIYSGLFNNLVLGGIDMGRIDSDSDNSVLLSSSFIGNIRKCGCCDSYHLSLGNITPRLQQNDVLALTEMLVEALELNFLYKRGYRNENA